MAKEYTLGMLAKMTEATVKGDCHYIVSGVSDLINAHQCDVSFLANPKYHSQLHQTKAGAICVHQHNELPQGKNYLISNDPSKNFQKIMNILISSENRSSGFEGIHPTAVIHPSAKIGDRVALGPYVVVDKNVEIKKNTTIFSGAYIGSGCKIGENCVIYSNVTIREETIIGNRVILQPGAVIGSCGFGYIPDESGRFHKLDQMGIVVIEDDVEIGACSTIDRARFKETRICQGTKIDNLVQIGHNVTIGEHNVIVSQVGIAGSSKTGKHVMIGGQVGIVGHLTIADGAMIGSGSGVRKSVDEKNAKIGGAPAKSLDQWRRQEIHINRLPKYAKEIQNLEKKIEELKEAIQEMQKT